MIVTRRHKEMDLDKLLTIKEAASLLHVSEMSLRRWTNAGKLKCYRVGGNSERRFNKQDLLNFLHAGGKLSIPLGMGEHSVAPSSHIAHFYQTVDEGLAGGVAYLRAGLARGERLLLIAPDNRLSSLLNALDELGVPVKRLLDDGVITMDSGRHDAGEHIQFMISALADADCPNGLRLLGDMTWALEKSWSLGDLTTLEHYTNNSLTGQNRIFLCQYDVQQFGAAAALMAFNTHSLTNYRGDLQESPYFLAGNS